MEQLESIIALHKVLGCTTAIILTIFFCKMKIFPLLQDLAHTKLCHIL